MVMSALPNFRNFRVFNIVALLATTFTSWVRCCRQCCCTTAAAALLLPPLLLLPLQLLACPSVTCHPLPHTSHPTITTASTPTTTCAVHS